LNWIKKEALEKFHKMENNQETKILQERIHFVRDFNFKVFLAKQEWL